MVPRSDFTILIERVEAVDSTNRLAAAAIRSGRTDRPTAFVARRQEAGQGREGRVWHSPEGGLWCTLAWPVAGEPSPMVDGLGLRIGVACLRTVRAALTAGRRDPARAALKWPNDVLIGGKKICGCLCRVMHESGRSWLIIGVGINVNNDPESLGPDLRRPATSLAREIGAPASIDEVLGLLLRELAAGAAGGGATGLSGGWLEEARAALFGIGEETAAALPGGGVARGKLVGLDDHARVMIETPNGLRTAAHAVELVEPSVE